MNNKFTWSLVILTIFVSQVKSKDIKCSGLKLERVGCYKENTKDRTLSHLVVNYRNQIDWKNYGKFFEKFACDCANKVLKHGYRVMGLQFYGECWSRKDAKNRYAKYGTSKKCVNLKYKECQNGMDCVGKEETNFVYKVQKDLPSPTVKPTTPGVRSPKPSGSGTSTAKKPPSPTKVPSPCSQPQPCQPVVYVSSVVPGPYAQSSSNGAMVHLPSCGPKCSPQCVPSCNVGCCLSHYRGKPMQRQNRCRRGCPTKCAPKCLPGCCRLFGGLHKDSAISKHTGTSLDDE